MKPATKPRKNAKRVRRATAPAPASWLHEPFLERAAEPAHQDTGQQALGAFLTLRLIDRFAPDCERHPGALEYQTRATRDYLLDLHAQTAEVGHLLEIVRVADAVRSGNNRRLLWSPLLAYAFWLEEELRLAEALDVVDTALRLNEGTAVNEEVAAKLQQGRILRLTGRFDEARGAYETARAKAMSIGDMHSALLGRIGDAIVMRQVGNLPASEKALREILKDAEEINDGDAQARARHDLGAVFNNRGQGREAIPHLYRAFELYGNSGNKLRAMSDVGEALKREGRYAPARDAFLLVMKGNPTKQIRACTMIALLELSVLLGDRLGFARWRQEITQIVEDLPTERRADFHLQLGLGHAAFGQSVKAERCLREALTVAEQHRLNEYTFRAGSALAALENRAAPNRPELPVQSGADDSKELAEIAEKLHALRAK